MAFIKKYHIDAPELFKEHMAYGISGSATGIVEKICAVSLENHENIVMDEILKVAKESGFTDLYILDKAGILEALGKQVPKPLNDGCPICHYDLREEDYCPGCGQKILKDALGYSVREELA